MNILRKIREQRLVDRAYSNGYEQGRFDAAMERDDLEAKARKVLLPEVFEAERDRFVPDEESA